MNKQIEAIAAIIVRDGSAEHVHGEMESLKSMISDYNGFITSLSSKEALMIDDKGVVVLNRLNDQLALNTLARIQQQVAVNENCYLSAKAEEDEF